MSFQREATAALKAHAAGNQKAVDRLIPLVYRELRRLAGRMMRHERRGHTLTPTALVHEAYVRLVDNSRIDWQGKTHFFALAAREMRQILVQHARMKRARKRGAGLVHVTLDDDVAAVPAQSLDIVALDEALERLQALSERQCRVVELRIFSGMDVAETAFVLGVSERTVKNDWRMARVWLARELSSSKKS